MTVPVKPVERRQQVFKALELEEEVVPRSKANVLSDVERAAKLGIAVSELDTPFQLTPAVPRVKTAYLDVYSSIMVASQLADATGSAWFHSSVRWPDLPGAQITFPRIKKGQTYLVEFHVQLFNDASKTYEFRTFSYPLDITEDISLSGGQAIPIVVLIEPVDEIDGALDMGAEIMQLNEAADDAGWELFSVHVSATQ